MTIRKKQQVYFVSFPRSGHHILIKFLDYMAGIGDEYCEFYGCINHKGERYSCVYENYTWVNKHYRCGSGKRLLKNHDFDLSLPIRKEILYVIQYRHPFYSIKSWYELDLRNNHDLPEWDAYLRSKLNFWIKFIRKWVTDNLGKANFFFIQYEEIGSEVKLHDLARFIGSDVKQKLEPGYFSEKRSMRDANPGEVKTLRLYEESIASILGIAGINRLFNDDDWKS